MKTKLVALALLAGSSMFAQSRFSVGVQFGGNSQGYHEPAPVYAAPPPCPGPDYDWVDGYWSQNSGRRVFVQGYWNRQPVVRAYENRYDERRERGHESNRYGNGFRGR